MKAKPECHRCFLRQAATAVGLTHVDQEAGTALLQGIQEELAGVPEGQNPAITASRLHARIREVSANSDPYREKKWEATAHALALYPKLKQLVAEATDPIDTAIRLAIAGNIIDLGVSDEYNLEASIERVLTLQAAVDHSARLRTAIDKAGSILFLGDNAGETVLDRLLIETLDKPVTYVVKGGPAVNDATLEDAREAGLEAVCEIISNGAAAMGTLLDQCSEAFRERFNAADLVIAKGMANFESLHGSRSNLFFLLQAKCAVVAAHLKVAEKSIVILENHPQTEDK
jgi:uncharacterized protein with ATP-grasp and redox domains